MKILARPLAGSSLVRDYLAGRPEALAFYPAGHPADPAAYEARARAVEVSHDRASRARLAGMLRGGGPKGAERLAAFVEGEGYAVTTGQQPGLFGGPLFSLYKGLGAAALARRLEARLGRPVIPVFWVASEDHDWEEVRGIELADVENELRRLELPEREGAGERPLHRLHLGATIDALRERLIGCLPPSDFVGEVEASLAASYHPGATLPGAFATLLAEQLSAAGVFLLSPEHPTHQAASLPLLLAEAEGAALRDAELLARSSALEAAGYPVQVPILPGGVNLFLEGAEGRDRLFLDRNPPGEMGFRLRREGRVLSHEALETEAQADPAILSPNVLLRPVVEAALVPTLAYMAGPGEMAYLAQTAPVFAAHGVHPPVVHPRPSMVVVERRVQKVLDKFSLALDTLARPEHEVVSRIARDEMPPEVLAALGGLRGRVAEGAKALSVAVRGVDPTLTGPVDHFRNQALGLLADVERKVVQALKREQAIALQQVAKAQFQLFPGGRPQERVFPAIYFQARYGSAILEAWEAGAEEAMLLPPT